MDQGLAPDVVGVMPVREQPEWLEPLCKRLRVSVSTIDPVVTDIYRDEFTWMVNMYPALLPSVLARQGEEAVDMARMDVGSIQDTLREGGAEQIHTIASCRRLYVSFKRGKESVAIRLWYAPPPAGFASV